MRHSYNLKSSALISLFSSESNSEEFLLENSYYQDIPASVIDIICKTFWLSLQSFGSEADKLTKMNDFFVRENKLISNRRFNFLLSIAEFLPGSTLLMTLLAIATLQTRSGLTGILTVLIYILPNFLLMCLIGTILVFVKHFFERNQLDVETEQTILWLNLLANGIAQSCIGVILDAIFTIMLDHKISVFCIIIIVVSSVAFYFIESLYCVGAIFLVCGIASTLKSDFNYFFDKTEIHLKTDEIYLSGWKALLLLLSLYALIMGIYIYQSDFEVLEYLTFLNLGLLTYGKDTSIIALGQAILDFENDKFIVYGYFFTLLLPGPTNGLIVFASIMLYGAKKAIILCLLAYITPVLLFLSLLNYLNDFKYSYLLQQFQSGVELATVGLMIAAEVSFWEEFCLEGTLFYAIVSTLNILLSFWMSNSKKVGLFFTVLVNSVLLLLVGVTFSDRMEVRLI